MLIFLPQIFILFLILTSLEECGYLAACRVPDGPIHGARGAVRQIVHSASLFVCLRHSRGDGRAGDREPRDRLTTILIAPLMSCGARLPVYTLMIAAFIPDRHFLGGLLGLQGLVLFSMYVLGIVVASGVALILKRTLLKGVAPPFLMEMPVYKLPSPAVVLNRMLERGWDFVRNAGTIIFAVSIVMWGALYYPRVSPGDIAPLIAERDRLEHELDAANAAGDATSSYDASSRLDQIAARIEGTQERQSILGRVGRLIEPVVLPLGWDWRIGSGVIASFPAAKW